MGCATEAIFMTQRPHAHSFISVKVGLSKPVDSYEINMIVDATVIKFRNSFFCDRKLARAP